VSCTTASSLRGKPAAGACQTPTSSATPAPLGRRDGETRAAWEKRLTPKQRAELTAWRKAHRWHPHQLRHTAATEIRKAFGLEAAQLTLGHSSAQVTDAVYAERDAAKVAEIMRRVG
jgi:integrase